MKFYSDEAPAGDESATHEVRFDREFRLHDDPDVVVHPSDLVKAYKYGPQVRHSATLSSGCSPLRLQPMQAGHWP